MSRLFLAKDLTLHRRVVIKILPPELVSQMMLARFKRESEVTAQLQHPHILPVISAGVRDGLVHYIMPFIDGESLRGRLEREGSLPLTDCLRLLREVTDALAYAHRKGIIHRDIKPENILIQDGHAVLADFGIAAALAGNGGDSGPRLTGTGMSLGTVGYMAPEQALGERNVDARADIYAVGVVGYEMLAGSPPFTGETDQAILVAHLTRDAMPVNQVRAETPAAVADAIRKAMQKDPTARFQTAAEFRDALEGEAAVAPRRSWSSNWSFPAIPRKWAIGIPVAGLVLAAAFLFQLKSRANSGAVERITIAIAPFNALNSDLALWREGMVDVLARNLDGVGPFLTVSPAVAIKGFSGAADRTSAAALARRAKAQYAIFGTIVGSSSDTVRLRATLLNIATSRVWDYEGRDSTVEAAAGKFTVAVLRELGKTHRIGAVRQSSFGSSSIDALRAFLQGEQFFRRTSWDSASLSYARAIRFDGNFAIALRREAQVVGWQKDGKDSVARALWLKAGTLNRGLSPRDSLLIVADSLSAALAPVLLDSMNWTMVRRLFETVNTAAARYPDDPEVWYALGEARFHYGWSSTLGVTDRNILDAFNRSIALDSAFAPAYVHAVELAFSLDGANAGRRYSAAYLRSRPTDKEAEAIAIVDRVARGGVSGAATDSVLDQSSAASIMAAYFILRRWPDTSQTALRLLQSANRRPRSSPTFVADSTRLWNYMPLQLAYHGRLSEAYLLIGNRPSRMFVEMALLGAIPPDTATKVMTGWIDQELKHAYLTLPWLASQGDSQQLRRLIERADAESRVGTELPRRSARYRASSARAYLSLVRRDTADAIKRFTALADTLCVACYVDRLEAAKLLAARGRLQEAEDLVSQRVYNLITPVEIWIAFERADRKSTRLNSSHSQISYAVFCLKKKKNTTHSSLHSPPTILFPIISLLPLCPFSPLDSIHLIPSDHIDPVHNEINSPNLYWDPLL